MARLAAIHTASSRLDAMPNRLLFASALFACLAPVVASGQEPAGVKQVADDELKKFQGTWTVLSAETDGVLAPADRIADVRVVIKGTTHCVFKGESELAHEIAFAVDASAKPKAVTDTLPDGQELKGIYKLDGDILMSCVAKPGAERPNKFGTTVGSGHTLRVLRRFADDKQAKAAAEEYARFKATWKFESLVMEGVNMPAALLKDSSMKLDGCRFEVKDSSGSHFGTFVIDPLATPKLLDVVFTGGPEAGDILHGIYELDGDTYKVCLSMFGPGRPKEFASKFGSGNVLEVLKREK